MPAPSELHLALMEGQEVSGVSKSNPGNPSNPKYANVSNGNQEVSKSKQLLNLAHEIREWVKDGCGRFHVSEIDKEFNLKSRIEKTNRSKILNDLLNANIIERTGSVKGYYQKVDSDCPDIDFLHADNSGIDLWLPLGLNQLVKVMPKNILVFAGEPNVGKTALLLNTVLKNQDKKNKDKIFYFSSEMEGPEFKERLLLFEGISLPEWSFRPKPRTGAFHQVIVPDAINIIDFLEINDEFWKIGERFREIYDRLTTGVAIIAIQKNIGREEGIGGSRGMEKPRLYVSLSRNHPHGNIAKIVKMKGCVGGNHNGKQMEFKLHRGWDIEELTVWAYKEENENGAKGRASR